MTTSNKQGAPALRPPSAADSSSFGVPGTSVPTDLSDRQIAAFITESTPKAGPTIIPSTVAAGVEAVTATWHSGVQIDALWSIDETRNAFVRVAGVGWRKIYNGRDGSYQALVTLASQARQTNRPVNLREEADGMIYEIYVW